MAVDRKTFDGLTRRRFIAVSACASVALASGVSSANTRSLRWRGLALGTSAEIHLSHVDNDLARHAINQCVAEIRRLENMFSLYRADSLLGQLNRQRELHQPPAEATELFSTALQMAKETDGAFDITVQPLWQLYRDHFCKTHAAPEGPKSGDLKRVMKLVDYRQIEVSTHRIAFKRKGMAVTLNGIAQGFITDKIARLLQQNGFQNILVHLGETVGSGTKLDGTPWLAGIADPKGIPVPLHTVSLQNQSLATSAGSGHMFTGDGLHNHIFNPRTGHSALRYQSISVVAPSATTADALSTAFCSMSLAQIRQILAARKNTSAIIVTQAGDIIEL